MMLFLYYSSKDELFLGKRRNAKQNF